MKVKWGVIGAGGIAYRRTIPEGITQAANAELHAVMDVDIEPTRKIAEEFHAPRAYDSIDALAADAEVQAVYIATPVYLHPEHFEKVAAAGKHVLIEKALAPTVDQARAMVRTAEERGIMATEGYMMKFHPLHQRARKLVRQGRLGQVVFVRGQLSCWYPPTEGAWRQVPEQGGGGSLIDMATHIYDLFQYILGSRIVRVQALTDTVVHSYAVEDSATTLLRFENGCHGVVDSFFNIPDECCPRRIEIYGDKGAILGDGTIGQGGGTMTAQTLGEVRGYDADQKRTEEEGGFQSMDPGEYNMYRAEVEYLSDCILKNQAPTLNTLEEGAQILRIALAAYESARTGRAMDV